MQRLTNYKTVDKDTVKTGFFFITGSRSFDLYGRIEAEVKTHGNRSLSLKMESDYPVMENISTVIHIPKKEYFALDFRIPGWSKNTVIILHAAPFCVLLPYRQMSPVKQSLRITGNLSGGKKYGGVQKGCFPSSLRLRGTKQEAILRVHWIASGYALAMTTKRTFWTASVPATKFMVSHDVGRGSVPP
jgi:hypothetical protein